MTRLFNEPSAFADEMIEGFVAASGRWVRAVPGGVARSTRAPQGQVAVVIGGGSGHFPAFGGLVGTGLAHGAALGNVFASPSARQVHSVAKAADNGGGVLLSYGNYAGDVLNFGQAQDRLVTEGIACESVAVTDDISSAPVGEEHKRRGIAGDLAVFKAAAAAAEEGYSLPEVARVARAANSRTRSFGVAFSGCTLPGAEAPLFTVPEGRMAVGLGIHGEAGIDEVAVPTADELAELLVGSLLAELPADVGQARGSRAAVVLNGLGSVKYEELFVVYRRVSLLLQDAGVEIVEPDVGEFCTSFDMAGVSLTLTWLDDELERFWRAPADTAAYRKGTVVQAERYETGPVVVEDDSVAVPDADKESRAAADTVLAALHAIATVIDENAEELGRIDAVAGDGDHGIGMQRGATAALEAGRAVHAKGAGAGTLLSRAADAWANRAGGTSGALWGVGLNAIGTVLGDAGRPDATAMARGVAAAQAAVIAFGKAELGDKTLVDVLVPFSRALEERAARGESLVAAWGGATDIAEAAAEATASLLPRIGRARTHVQASLGTRDAGAVSLALICRAVHRELLNTEERDK